MKGGMWAKGWNESLGDSVMFRMDLAKEDLSGKLMPSSRHGISFLPDGQPFTLPEQTRKRKEENEKTTLGKWL